MFNPGYGPSIFLLNFIVCAQTEQNRLFLIAQYAIDCHSGKHVQLKISMLPKSLLDIIIALPETTFRCS